ncbi:DNA topoisomerase-3 [Desulfonatronum thiosulfatophilum]|uniref:DNA topoisomerase n=1 Tax=Desulfonatronum thiosulfatophilum TaxID=617002 RepID=A0A1G6AXG9_9BACT|nr:DNA topoisomerase 3 [Desulfonatronum thiosulfatophilum]SDB13101.1 DNA topoisomerase-3 [Desulfonatronum thiosulfatophilum]
MKPLILAEKPSAGRDLARVLKVASKASSGRSSGYLENEQYVISWMIGHLLGYAFPGEQNPAWVKWSFANLPMFPENFQLKEMPSTASQLGVLRGLLAREDVGEIIVATDAGREGELIFRHLYGYLQCSKPFRRLWILDNTDAGIRKAFAELQPGHKFDNLAASARARSESDWLVGMNFSRAYTIKGGDKFSIGRVQTPVLALLVHRRKAIDAFVSEPFFTCTATVRALSGETDETEEARTPFPAQVMAPPDYSGDRFATKQDAADQAAKVDGQDGIVAALDQKEVVIAPPLLYDLTALQKEANARYGFSAKQTLDMAQKLYEVEKVITYPRTDSQYITQEIFKEMPQRMAALPKGYKPLIDLALNRLKSEQSFACVNDAKVTDHYAILPTGKTPSSSMAQPLKQLYDLVARRLLAAFLPPAKVQNTKVILDVSGEKLHAGGKIFMETGWLVAEPWRKGDDVVLPLLRQGDAIHIDKTEVKASKTKPPSHFTEKTLLGAMEKGEFEVGGLENENIMGLEDQSQPAPTVGIGRPSTRAAIIELLVERGYVRREKKRLIATDTGTTLIDFVESTVPQLTSAKITHLWEKNLEDIAQGKDDPRTFITKIKQFTRDGITILARQPAKPRVRPPEAQLQAAKTV